MWKETEPWEGSGACYWRRDGKIPRGHRSRKKQTRVWKLGRVESGHTLMVKRPWKTQKGISTDSSWFLTSGGLDVRVPFGALFDTRDQFS